MEFIKQMKKHDGLCHVLYRMICMFPKQIPGGTRHESTHLPKLRHAHGCAPSALRHRKGRFAQPRLLQLVLQQRRVFGPAHHGGDDRLLPALQHAGIAASSAAASA